MAQRLTERSKRFFENRDVHQHRDKLRQDDFSGAEIDREISLLAGSEQAAIAHLRLRALQHAARMRTLGRATGAAPGDTVPGAANWVQMGPMAIPNGQTYTTARVIVSGRIASIAVHPTSPSTIYIASARGGVWKTTDGGQSWAPMSDNQVSLAMGAIALAPSAPDTIYAGTGEGNIYYLTAFLPLNALNESYQGSGLLKSTSGGSSWTLQGTTEFTGAAFYRIAVHPTNPDLAYAATSRGIYRTENGGATWTQLSGGLPAISSTVIAATDVVIDPATPANVYAAFWGAGIYVTTNGGTIGVTPTWSVASGGPGSSAGRIGLAIAPTAPSTVYALAATPSGSYLGFYRNTGGTGGAFNLVTPSVGATPAVSTSKLFTVVDVSTPDTVYLCGTSLHKATRDVVTGNWTFTDIGGPIHPDVRTLALHPTNNQIIFAGTDGGIYQSGDGGTSWTDAINKRLCITQFEFADHHPAYPAVVFSGTQDNGTEQYRTSEVFYHADDGDGGDVAIDQNTPTNILNEHFSASPQRSTQGGKFGTFASVSAGLAGASLFYPPFALDATNSNNIAFGTDRLCLDASQGTGGWPIEVTLPGIGGRVSAITYVNSALIYAATSSGEVYRAVQSMGTWTATAIHASPLPTRWIWHIVVSPTDSNAITVALGGFGGGHVYRGVVNLAGTSATWTDRSGSGATGLPDAPANSLAPDPAHPLTFYVGTDVGVYVSTDDGTTWNDFRQGLPNTAVYDLKLHGSSRLLRAATHGRGMWEREIDVTSLNDTIVYVRDNIMHTGRAIAPYDQPAAFEDLLQHIALGDHVYWWQCADIKNDSDAGGYQMPVSSVDFVLFESQLAHRDPIRTHVNHVFVQVHNRGIAAADVTAKILFADASAGLPTLPADFWTAFPGDPSPGLWTPIGAAATVTVKPGEPTIFSWNWTPPSTAAQHSCLLVVCDSAADPIPTSNKVFDIGTLVNTERHVGLKNLHVVDPTEDVLVVPFTFYPRGVADRLRIVASHLAGWQVGLVVPLPVGRRVAPAVGRVAVPRTAAGKIAAHARQHSDLFEHGEMLHVSHEAGPIVFEGLHHGASFLAFLVLVRPPRVRRGSITIIHEHDGNVLGGNTFVIAPPVEKSSDGRA